MNIRNLILAWTLGAGLLLAAGHAFGQDAAAQNQAGQAQTGTTGGDQSGQSSGGTESGTVRTAPAAALSSLAGMQGDSAEGEDTGLELPQIPALLGGRGMSLAFPAEMERSNYLRGGVNVGAMYDDNALLASTGQESNTSESVFPNIAIEESTTRTRWTLGYAGGLTVNQKITSQNQGSQNLNFDSLFRLSPHVNLRVAENFSMTTGYLDSTNGEQVVTEAGAANASVITPLATQRMNTTTVEGNYHFALNDLLGASGSYYDLHFSNVPAGVVLSDTQTATGSVFWLHKMFRGDWAGLSYRFQRITIGPQGETLVDTAMLVDSLKLGNGFSLSAFAGPQYAANTFLLTGETQTSQSNHWSGAGGLEAGWRNKKTSLIVGYSRAISDGGGLLGAVRLENEYGNLRRELAPGWAATLTAGHGTNTALEPPSAGSPTSINLTSVGAGLERNIGKSLGLQLGYTHDFQQQFEVPSAVVPGSVDASRNRFVVTLSYQWAKPLGM